MPFMNWKNTYSPPMKRTARIKDEKSIMGVLAPMIKKAKKPPVTIRTTNSEAVKFHRSGIG